jgi:hypothetical protein
MLLGEIKYKLFALNLATDAIKGDTLDVSNRVSKLIGSILVLQKLR